MDGPARAEDIDFGSTARICPSRRAFDPVCHRIWTILDHLPRRRTPTILTRQWCDLTFGAGQEPKTDDQHLSCEFVDAVGRAILQEEHIYHRDYEHAHGIPYAYDEELETEHGEAS